MKIIFMGTPDFAVPSLKAIAAKGYEIAAVICQPDRARDRKGNLIPVPVKTAATELGVPVFQFDKIREHCDVLRACGADIGVTAAFGQILTQEILDIPRFGVINVHASLLPKYRGSSPIQWAVINGESETGVTIMQTERGLDTGNILRSISVPIGAADTAGDMFDRLKEVGAQLLTEELAYIDKNGRHIGDKQKEEDATHCRLLTKEDGVIDWARDSLSVYNLIRGLNPWPVAFTALHGQTLKIYNARMEDGTGISGEIISESEDELVVACGKGAIAITRLQLPGKRIMSTKEFLRGHMVPRHTVLGN